MKGACNRWPDFLRHVTGQLPLLLLETVVANSEAILQQDVLATTAISVMEVCFNDLFCA